MSASEPKFYVTGGSLRLDTPSYVERQADRDLYEGLLAGDYCYVLTSRQMGKSSLMVRTAARLRQSGKAAVVIDLTAIGQNVTAEQWYRGLLSRLGEQLGVEDELEDFWLERDKLGPLQRFIAAIRVAILSLDPSRSLVVFIDEIDAVRSLRFSTDELFAAIRECYNRRPEDPVFQRLTFCLLGVATPADLIEDTRTTPFNIGRRIELTDFTLDETGPLSRGLEQEVGSVTLRERLLERVLYWTGGHPYLTQKFCASIVQVLAAKEDLSGIYAGRNGARTAVDAMCRSLFLSHRACEQDDNLLFVRERLLRGGTDLAATLDFYAGVLAGRRVASDETNPLLDLLRLAGVVRVSGSRLTVRNRIYARVFDRRWVTEHMPDAELRRQRAAFRRGLLRATGVAAVAVTVVLGLAGMAYSEMSRAESLAARLGKSLRTESKARQALEQTVVEVQRERTRANGAKRLADAAADRAIQAANVAKTNGARAERLRVVAQSKTEESRQRLVLSHMAAGERAVEEGDYLGALSTYAEAFRLDRRDTAQDEMHRTRLGSLLRLSPRLARIWFHGGPVNGARFSRDGRRVITASSDRTARIYDLGTGKVTTLQCSAPVSVATFSPDGRRALTASGAIVPRRAMNLTDVRVPRTGIAQVWDVRTGKPSGKPLRHKGAIASAEFSSDGSRIVTAAEDGLVRLWETASGTELKHHAFNGPIQTAVFSPDGNRVAVTDAQEVPLVWDLRTDQVLSVRDAPGRNALDLAFSPGGDLLAGATSGYRTGLWDSNTGSESGAIRHDDFAIRVAFSPDSQRLASGGLDGTARVLDIKSRLLTSPMRHMGPVWSVEFGPESREVLTGSDDRTARIWDAGTGLPVFAPLRHGGAVTAATYSPDGRHVLTASTDGTSRLYELAPARPRTLPNAHGAWISAIVFTASGKQVATAGGSREVVIRNPATLATESPILKSNAAVSSLEFSADGRRLAGGCYNGETRIWDRRTGKVLHTFASLGSLVSHVHFSRDDRLLITSGRSPLAVIWDLSRGRRLWSLRHETLVTDACFSPDGRLAATASHDHTAQLWDLRTGKRVGAPLRHSDLVNLVAFSPNGQSLLTAGEDGSAQLWDVRTGRPAAPRLRLGGSVQHAVFSRNGRRIATASADGTARIWDAHTGLPVGPSLIHRSAANYVAFSSDGSRLLTLSRDRTARLWEARTGQALTPPLPHTMPLNTAGLSPDGHRVLTGMGGYGALFSWDVSPTRLPAALLVKQAHLFSNQRFDQTGAPELLEAAALRPLAAAWRAAGGERALELEALPEEPTPVEQWPPAGNLVENGDFEDSPELRGQWQTVPVGSRAISGWEVSAGSVDLVATSMVQSWNGRLCLDLDGNEPGAIRRAIPTVPGQRYLLSFRMAANLLGGSRHKQMLVRAAGASQLFGFDGWNQSSKQPRWASHMLQFTATSRTTRLDFVSRNASGSTCGVLLDGISVTQVKTPGAPVSAASRGGFAR